MPTFPHVNPTYRFEKKGWFSEGFDTADLQKAKALLSELA
jgi:hypothetical protein